MVLNENSKREFFDPAQGLKLIGPFPLIDKPQLESFEFSYTGRRKKRV
jgi:hypothetical protein